MSRQLKKLNPLDYQTINDITLYQNGYTSQIDHIVVSRYGVFVIETKNYKGWIVGGERSKYWKQVIYKNQYPFYNPILQNYGHIKALKNYLSAYPSIPYIPIVVFTNRATIKVWTSSEVIYIDQLFRTITKYTEAIISDAMKDKILDILHSVKHDLARDNLLKSSLYTPNIQTQRIHFCPLCDGRLTIRQGRYGKFKECSNFPNCKHIEPL